jgi:inorganic pyrophosphatase
MRMRDDKGQDDKIIAVHEDDPAFVGYRDIGELPQHIVLELRRFFLDYKTLEGKEVVVEGFLNAADALTTVREAIALYARDREKLV